MLATAPALAAEVAAAVRRSRDHLCRVRRPDGSWQDRLTSSTVATSAAVLALAFADPEAFRAEIAAGTDWIGRAQREDGGWSDAESMPPSSLSATALALTALEHLAPEASRPRIPAGDRFLRENGGYDVLYDVPKAPVGLAALVLMDLTGHRERRRQPPQPVEVILLPQALRNRVSIGLPGVLALGLMQTRRLRSRLPRRLAQRLAEPRALEWLRSAQEADGGIEECPLLCAIVLNGLTCAGLGADIVRSCLAYLLKTRRADGSWPVDRDLEISVTAYVSQAFAELDPLVSRPDWLPTREWLLAAQQQEPFRPLGNPGGGWAWANPSGWPDSDDTAAVLVALHDLGVPAGHGSVQAGLRWLAAMQNRDGAWSEWVKNAHVHTDVPCPAVTAQVVLALAAYGARAGSAPALDRALRYLRRAQRPDGSFHAVWFNDSVYGTSRVLEMYSRLGLLESREAAGARRWLVEHQAADGSWAGEREVGPTVEETAWALYALLEAGLRPGDPRAGAAASWLAGRQLPEGSWAPSPVGRYFPNLRYASDHIANAYALRALSRWLVG